MRASCLDRLRVARPALDQAEAADHRLQHVVEVVRDAAGELAQRLHALRLREPGLGLPPLAGFLLRGGRRRPAAPPSAPRPAFPARRSTPPAAPSPPRAPRCRPASRIASGGRARRRAPRSPAPRRRAAVRAARRCQSRPNHAGVRAPCAMSPRGAASTTKGKSDHGGWLAAQRSNPPSSSSPSSASSATKAAPAPSVAALDQVREVGADAAGHPGPGEDPGRQPRVAAARRQDRGPGVPPRRHSTPAGLTRPAAARRVEGAPPPSGRQRCHGTPACRSGRRRSRAARRRSSSRRDRA